MAMHVETVGARAGDERQQPAVVEEQLICALTGQPVSHAEAYWAPPLITARQLIGTVISALFTAPSTLGPLLFDEQPNVPYAPAARDQLAARRSAEQVKLLVLLLVVVSAVALPLMWLIMR